MAQSSFLCFILVLETFSKGVSAGIQTQQTVLAAVGEQACLKCQLTLTKDVRQVTWQKLLPGGEKTLATYSKNFGSRVNTDINEKIDFQYAELKNCSMVIKKVTEEDEGCYQCLFNIFRVGAVMGKTCLRIYAMHEPILHVRESNSSAGSVVSCSATGRPAPNVTLTVTHQHLSFSHHNTTSVQNRNGTFTITATAVLPGFHDDSIQVGCAAGVLSGPQMEVFAVIPKRTSHHGVSEKLQSDGLFIICVLVALIIVVVIIVVWFKRQKHKTRDSEMNKTPLKADQDAHQTSTLLIQKEDSVIRQRTPAKESLENSHPKPSSSKKLFQNVSSTPT